MDPLIINIILIALAIVIAFVLYKALKSAKKIAINILVGFLLILVANWFVPGVNVPIFNLVTLLVTALSGAFGALILIVLNLFGINLF
jgi:SigmaK-factor processing regulatory protein BofA.